MTEATSMNETVAPKGRFHLHLQGKFILGFLLLSLILSTSSASISFMTFKNAYQKNYTDAALQTAWIAASLVPGDDISRYLSEGQTDEAYDALQKQLNELKRISGVVYLYIFYPHADGYQYFTEAYTPQDDMSEIFTLGQIQPYVSTTTRMMHTFKTGEPFASVAVTDSSQGYLASVFVPVYDSQGNIVALSGVDLAMDGILLTLREYLILVGASATGIVFAFILMYLAYLRRSLIRPVQQLTQQVDAFIQSDNTLNFDPLPIRTGDEVQSLAEAFARMTVDIQKYIVNIAQITADRERIETELAVAQKIQKSMLPYIFPAFPECKDFDIFASMDPAKEVGGDFYDLFRIDEDRLCFLVADVSGKGVPAALFMMMAKILIKNEAMEGKDLAEVCMRVNRQLCENNDACMFVTAFLATLDTRAQTLTYCNAGHNPPLIRRKGGAFEYMKPRRTPPLAVMDGIRYRSESVPFHTGDMVFLYTDGVTEAQDPVGDLYGEDRLIRALYAMEETKALDSVLTDLRRDVDAYCRGAEQADDITMLIVRSNKG